MGSGDIVVGNAIPKSDPSAEKGPAETADPRGSPKPRQQQMCGAMSQQGDGNHSPSQPAGISQAGRLPLSEGQAAGRAQLTHRYWMNSPHFWTALSVAPQGMTGTVEVEFFGEPSISLSE